MKQSEILDPNGLMFQCPWCASLARASSFGAACEARSCVCGAVVIGAPAPDFEEVVAEAMSLFGVDPDHLTPFDGDRVAGLRARGVEIHPGWRIQSSKMDHLLYEFYWFRRE